MKFTFLRPLCFLLLVASVICVLPVSAASKKKGSSPDPGIRGAVTAVTTTSPASIIVSGKDIQVDDTTTITLDGRPAKLKDLKVGIFAQVNTFTLGDQLTAISIRAFTKAPPDTGKDKKKKKKNKKSGLCRKSDCVSDGHGVQIFPRLVPSAGRSLRRAFSVMKGSR